MTNFEKAMKIADAGDVEKQLGLATCFEDGIGCAVNYELAMKYYKMAADQGNAMAQYCLGRMYEEGKGVEVDYDMALAYYKLSAEEKNKFAIYHLGMMYKDGKGVKTDLETAIKYFEQAKKESMGLAEKQLMRIRKIMNVFTEKDMTINDKKNSKGKIKRITDYDSNGFIIHEKKSTGDEVWYENDSHGKVVRAKDFEGKVRKYKRDYNAEGLEVHYKCISDDYEFEVWNDYLDGNCVHTSDSDGEETWTEFNSAGKKLNEKTSDGREFEYEYDANGNLSFMICREDGLELKKYYTKDKDGKLLKYKCYRNGNLVSDCHYEYQLDDDGRVMKKITYEKLTH